MPRIARIRHNGETHHALVEADHFRMIRGHLFGEWTAAPIVFPAIDTELLAPVEPPQIIRIGANNRKHSNECGTPSPGQPRVFFKRISAVAGPGDVVELSEFAPDEVDWGAELVIVIGKQCSQVSEDEAGDYILGYTCGNDISARNGQSPVDTQRANDRGFDTFASIGPWITTGIDGDDLDIALKLNGKLMQKSNTSDMICSCRSIVSYLSHSMTLYPGSIIMTGAPSGVGMGLRSAEYLRSGDRLTVEIEGIGRLVNRIETVA